MKKFISMVMAAAMVVSLVPATAFAKGEVTASAKVVDAMEENKDFNGIVDKNVPELQMKIKDVDYQKTNNGEAPEMDVTVTLDNADFALPEGWDPEDIVGIRYDDADISGAANEAVEKAQKALDTAEDALATAEAAAEGKVNAALKEAVTEAETAVETAQGVVDSAETAVETAQGTVDTKQTAVDTTYDAYITAVEAGNVGTTKTEWEAAKDKLEDAQNVLAAKEAALAEAQADLTEKEAALAEAKAAVTEAAKNDADVATAKEAVAKAEKALEEAQNSAEVSNVTFKDAKLVDDNELEFTIVGELHAGDIVYVDLYSKMDKVSEGRKATVSVESKMVDADDLAYVTILDKGLKASVKKVVDVAEEEVVKLNDRGLKIESVVGDLPSKLTLKISKGFEFTKACEKVAGVSIVDDNELEVTTANVKDAESDEITIVGLEIEATTAKSGATATITVKSSNFDSASVEVAKVVDYKVTLSVDEDEDVPVIYSGVNVNNDGITDDSDHMSLEVTAEETFPGAWSFRKGFNFELPAGVYVTNVEVTDTDGILKSTAANLGNADYVSRSEVKDAFYNAYQDGDHLNFEFEKRVFDDVDATLNEEKASMTFQLELVADPTFEGDVVLKLTGDLVDEQTVTIAKFVKPYTVKAEQNDLKIDYRYTEVPTAITITEAEAGLWSAGKDKAEFWFSMDKDYIDFEDDATFEVDKDSELEIKDKTNKDGGELSFYVKSESDEAATVTIKDISLFMQRNIPAGPYDLKIKSSLANGYDAQKLFAPDETSCTFGDKGTHDEDKECYVDDVCDYSSTVKEGFINIITAGREVDDASFTTKVVVPVGEAYLIAGENQVALDVPAYINAAGYTMLPVRAVATALGINNSNVLWDGPTKTVTILYGQRIITMAAGQKVVYVNGSAIPASASVEIVDGRTFLPMRDLATALGVTDITWDAATKTATLNGNQK